MVERNLDEFLDPFITDRSPFYNFKAKLVSHFEATKTFMNNIVQGLEEKRLEWSQYNWAFVLLEIGLFTESPQSHWLWKLNYILSI